MDNIKNLEGMGKTSTAVGFAVDGALVQYTSHPIMKYSIGRFQFENGLLTLTEQDDVDEFESVLADKNFPESERSRIKKIDVEAANKFVEERLANQRLVTQSFDSSIGERNLPNTKLGTGRLEDSMSGGALKEGVIVVDTDGKVRETTNQIPGAPGPAVVTGTGDIDSGENKGTGATALGANQAGAAAAATDAAKPAGLNLNK